MGVTFAMTSDTCPGLSVDVGTFFCLVDAEDGEKRDLKDVRRCRRDRGGDGK